MGDSNGVFHESVYCGSNWDTYNAGGADPNRDGCWSNVAEASGATLNDYCSNTQYVPQHSFTCHVETGQNCSWQ